MRKVGNAFRHIRDVIRFFALPAPQRQLTFYSEGRNYWSYLGGLIEEILDKSEMPICYVCSSKDDPGMALTHPRLHQFLVGDGAVRDWFFANIDTRVMAMTMPDLHRYQVKRSKHPVHYVYVQHSLVSLHMVYRAGAFDHFDTVFCATRDHIKEIRALETQRGTSRKNIFEHGYSRLDNILNKKSIQQNAPRIELEDSVHYLLAPSWGENGTIETGTGAKIVTLLLDKGHKVTLRPHPQTLKFHEQAVQDIVVKHSENPRFNFEGSVEGHTSLLSSDVMICDWSGAALEYAFGLEKPVLFIDLPRKVNNPDYYKIPLEPFEARIRSEIGTVIDPAKLEDLLSFEARPLRSNFASDYVFNLRNSDSVGANEILRIVTEIEAKSLNSGSI